MLPELLALDFSNLELKWGGLPAAVGSCERARAPGRAAVHLRGVRELAKDSCIPEGHEDNAVVSKGGDGIRDGHFLPAAWGRGAHEHAGVLLGEGT